MTGQTQDIEVGWGSLLQFYLGQQEGHAYIKRTWGSTGGLIEWLMALIRTSTHDNSLWTLTQVSNWGASLEQAHSEGTLASFCGITEEENKPFSLERLQHMIDNQAINQELHRAARPKPTYLEVTAGAKNLPKATTAQSPGCTTNPDSWLRTPKEVAQLLRSQAAGIGRDAVQALKHSTETFYVRGLDVNARQFVTTPGLELEIGKRITNIIAIWLVNIINKEPPITEGGTRNRVDQTDPNSSHSPPPPNSMFGGALSPARTPSEQSADDRFSAGGGAAAVEDLPHLREEIDIDEGNRPKPTRTADGGPRRQTRFKVKGGWSDFMHQAGWKFNCPYRERARLIATIGSNSRMRVAAGWFTPQLIGVKKPSERHSPMTLLHICKILGWEDQFDRLLENLLWVEDKIVDQQSGQTTICNGCYQVAKPGHRCMTKPDLRSYPKRTSFCPFCQCILTEEHKDKIDHILRVVGFALII
jgi:hypothetical protein